MVTKQQYRYAATLYILSILSHVYYIIISCGVGIPVHGRDIVDCINTIDKRFIFVLMENVQLPVSKGYINQVTIHTTTQK